MKVKISGWDHFLNEPTSDTFEAGDDADQAKQVQKLKEKAEKIYNGACWTFSKAEVMQ